MQAICVVKTQNILFSTTNNIKPKSQGTKKNIFLAKSTLPMYATFPTTQKIKTWEEFTTPQLVVIVLLDDKSRQLSKQQ